MENLDTNIDIDKKITQSRGCCTIHSSQNNDELINVDQQCCCKLSTHDWLAEYNATDTGEIAFVEVRFKNGRKGFYSYPKEMTLEKGEIVAVEASPGHDIGIVSLAGEIVGIQMKRKQYDPEKKEIKRVFRHARAADIEKWLEVIALEHNTMIETRVIASNLNLEMKINDVEYQGDKTKAIFYYTAHDRVDFRELIKKLADAFKVRIEMKQIGVRQEAAKVGGIGPCGRELCCASFMSSFTSVSTAAARVQQLSLNPQKLAGQCGKLKCCLNYEVDDYIDTLKHFPDNTIPLKTKKGKAIHVKSDVFRKVMWFIYTDDPTNMMAISTKNVFRIQKMNKRGKFPADLEGFAEKNTQVDTADDKYGDDITGYI